MMIPPILQQEFYIPWRGQTPANFLLEAWLQAIPTEQQKYSQAWEDAMKQLNIILRAIFINDNTFMKSIVAFRKPLQSLQDPEIYRQSTYLLGPGREASLARREEYKEAVHQRNIDRASLTPIYASQVNEIIEFLKKSHNVYDMILLAELACGSRMIEVLKTSTYKAVDDPNQILIVGLAKQGNMGLHNSITRNLVGLDSSELIKLIKKIRVLKAGILSRSNIEISSSISAPLNKRFKELFWAILTSNNPQISNKELKTWTNHHTRYLYANLNYMINGEPKDIPYETFIQDELGHADAGSTKSYLAINLQP